MRSILKREFTKIKICFLLIIVMGIIIQIICEKLNGLSVVGYIIGTAGLISPASFLREL